jgi:phosphonate ABC transporter permease subunit PhnE
VAIVLAIVIYAYGFQVTDVSFEEISSERRQQSLTRVLRALAQPDILEYERIETVVAVPILVPCPTQPEVNPPEPDRSGPYLVIDPPCAEPRSDITIQGFNFEPNSKGPVGFIPPSQVTLNLGNFETDAEGHFEITARVPPRPNEQPQEIRAITRRNQGIPHLSKTALETWDKIVETVFLALLATTFGVFLAIPISFFAARNIMRDLTSTATGLALSLLAWPLGIWLGAQAAGWIGRQSTAFMGNNLLALAVGVISAGAAIFLGRWALPQEVEAPAGSRLQVVRFLALLAASLSVILTLFLTSNLMDNWGRLLALRMGGFGFLGTFFANLGEMINLIITLVVALGTGGLVSSFSGRFDLHVIQKLPASTQFAARLILSALAGFTLGALIGAGINWIYEIDNPVLWLWWPGGSGAILGLITALLARRRDVIPVGLAIYYVTRTILNGLRAIEALIMAIVFVVWVGIGPFAGVLALSLHTIAALAKLYSEQVESVSAGPLEAVKATGATRLQTIIYAVIPQIVPPYISFTMYRWDINVRMSTIIGFAGGGGIGFLLIQNINLLNYRAASAQMLAIAIVVAFMDFLSSYLRERVV